MKKLFTICAAVLVALATNAAVINITSETSDALRTALESAADGDEIVMAAGTYVESPSNYIAFTGKDVLVKAADGAEVLIQPQVSITVSEGGCAHFQNVKLDASHLTEVNNWYEHLIYAADAADNNRIVLEGCEVYGFNMNKSMFYCNASNKLAAVTINNCYIHNTMKSVLFVENSTDAVNVQVTNSTFANIATNTESYWAGIIDLRAAESQLLVDHCTFYDVIPMNTDYSCVSKITLANGAASNCIFMLSTAQDGIRAMRGVTATNCITFNYLKDSGTGIHSSVTQNNCVQEDPLFVDAANGDFTLGEGSPALTMNEGQAIGDPRWWPVAPAGCNWESLPWIANAALPQYADQFKICLGDPAPGVDVIQNPAWATAPGLYITFPAADFGTISLASSDYDIQGAGMILHMDAFTAKETEVTIVCQGVDYIFTIYNDKGSDVPTAIDNNQIVEKAQKFIENGQLFIIKNGVRYNAQGAVVK